MKKILICSLFFPCAAFAQIGTQVVTDTFTGSVQNPIAGNWTNGSVNTTNMTLSGSGNATPAAFGADDADAFWTSWASGNDQYSQAEITVNGTGAGAGMGVCVRRSATASVKTMYRVVLNSSGGFELARFTAGTFLSLRTGSVTYVAATKLGLSVSGSATTTLKIWYGGTQVGTDVTDSSSPLTTGNPGIAFSSVMTSASLDNWDAGTTGVTVATSTRPASKFFLFTQ